MIKISELLSLEIFEKFNIIAGENGLNNTVSNIGILEYEAEENLEKYFTRGDFVITTLFFASGDAVLLEGTLLRLIDLRISGLAIKNIYEYKIPQSVMDHSIDRAVPVFVSDALRTTNNQSYFEDRVNSIINRQASKKEVREVASDINSSFSENIITAYCVEKNYENDRNIMRILETIRLRKHRNINNIKNAIFKHKKGIMIIHSFEENEEIGEVDEIAVLSRLIEKVGIEKEVFSIGISDIHENLDELDICIRKGIYALDTSSSRNIDVLKFDEIGLNKFFMSLRDNYWVKEYYKSIISKIVAYDAAYNADLMNTLASYIDNRGEMSTTSKELFQHVNTIRYRLDKIKSITGIAKEEDFYEQMFIKVRFYKLNN